MRLYGPTGVRASPTDRNPSTVAGGGVLSIVGGTTSIISTYTVPAGRRALLTAGVSGVVTTALAAAQAARIDIEVLPAAGGTSRTAPVHFNGNPAGARGENSVAEIQLKAGDVINVRIQTGAGAGVFEGAGGFEGVEYDT